MLYHEWEGTFKAGQAGGGGQFAASRCRPGLSLRSLQFCAPPVATKQ